MTPTSLSRTPAISNYFSFSGGGEGCVPLSALGGVYMIPVWLSFRCEFIPVPTCGSVFVYMIPVRNAAPVRVIPVRVHSGSCTGTKVSFRYEGWPHSVPVSCKRGNKVRSGMKWVTELTGTSSACVLIRKTASDNEGSHRVIPVQQTSAFQCKRYTKIYLVSEWKSYRYHVNTPLESDPVPD